MDALQMEAQRQPHKRRLNGRRTDQLNQERRKEVVDAAARLFASRGFHGTSMDDIANEVGMLKGSLYYWIESKESVLIEIIRGAITSALAEAREIAARDLPASERLRLLIHSHIKSWEENPHNFDVFNSEFRWIVGEEHIANHRRQAAELEQYYKDVVRDGMSSGEFPLKSDDITIVVNGIFGMLNWFPRWYHADGWASSDYIADMFASIVVGGLRGERAAAVDNGIAAPGHRRARATPAAGGERDA